MKQQLNIKLNNFHHHSTLNIAEEHSNHFTITTYSYIPIIDHCNYNTQV